MPKNAVQTWVDEQTGREVRQLTALPEGASVPYFRMPKHLPDGWMLVHARHENGHLAALHPDTAELRPIRIGPPLGYLKHRPADGQAWFVSGREIWTAVLPDGEAERLACVPDDVPGSIADITCDGRTVILVEIVEEKKLALPIAQDAEYFWRFFARRRHGRIWAWDVASGALTKLVETTDVGFQHIDTSPADPTLVRYCHDMFEATGQRIWSVRTGRPEPRLIRRQAPGEMITHEFWWPDPSLIGYTYQDRRDDPTLHDLPWAELAPPAVATRLGIADLEGREVYLSEPLNCYHTHLYVSRDGRAVCGEGTLGHSYAYAAPFSMDEPRVDLQPLATVHTPYLLFRGQQVNCDFSADGRWLLFNDTVDGHLQVLAVRTGLEDR